MVYTGLLDCPDGTDIPGKLLGRFPLLKLLVKANFIVEPWVGNPTTGTPLVQEENIN